jgi:hypothetical protein
MKKIAGERPVGVDLLNIIPRAAGSAEPIEPKRRSEALIERSRDAILTWISPKIARESGKLPFSRRRF